MQEHVVFPLILSLLILLTSACGALTTMPEPDIECLNLTCEFLENPIGLDEARPRLSWEIRSERRGVRQAAWQVIAASTLAKLESEDGDLWDSGKVESSRSVHIPYGGRALASGQRCWWKVRVWADDGALTPFSTAAFWEAGLLDPMDWEARWIGFDTGVADEAVFNVAGSHWIWIPGDETPQENRKVFFRRSFKLVEGAVITSARLLITADNSWSLCVNGGAVEAEKRWATNWKSIQEIDLTDRLVPGDNVLAACVTNSNGPGGLLAALEIEDERGGTIRMTTDSQWLVHGQEIEGWTDAAFDESRWQGAVQVAAYGEEPWGDFMETRKPAPCPFLRRTFDVKKPVARARLHATALGVYEMHLNGERVGRDWLTPGWTDYNDRIQVQTYDVTGLLGEGPNVLGAILGDGWYAGSIGWECRRHNYGPYPLGLLAHLRIDYEDGTWETVATDGSWKASSGPIIFSDFLLGETYDARLEMPGWSRTGYDDNRWKPVSLLDGPEAPLKAQHSPTVQRVLELDTKEVASPAPGVHVFDLGQNMVGWARLKVQGKAGTRVQLRFAEMLQPDGHIYIENLRSAKNTDVYILKGDGEEVFEPRFTFRGFLYVEVTGFPGEPGPEALTGIVAYSATPGCGTFRCSSPLVNQLVKNIVWGQRGNFLSVPTDCPQRDERLGWLGDAQIFAMAATYNMDVAAFFTKWMKDVEDAQSDLGAYPDVAPRLVAMTDGAPAWGDAGIIVPWTMYLCYDDAALVRRHYESMQRWIAYILEGNPGFLRTERLNNNYGDWVSINAKTPKDVLATAYFARCARLMSRMAAILGKKEDAARYAGLFDSICGAFNEAYVDDEVRVKGDTQTAYLLALEFELLPEGKREAAARHLMEAIERRDGHLSTGFLGVGHLLPALTNSGLNDAAYRLLLNETFPSWGYSIRQGATTIWERWDGWTEEKGFQTPGMNSFNHYAFGSVGAWIYGVVGGIAPDPSKPGYERIIIHPRPGGGLTFAEADYHSIRGPIRTAWKKEKGRYVLDVTIPGNSSAEVHVPLPDAGSEVREGGKPAAEAECVKFLRNEDGFAVFAVGSGSYRFEVGK